MCGWYLYKRRHADNYVVEQVNPTDHPVKSGYIKGSIVKKNSQDNTILLTPDC